MKLITGGSHTDNRGKLEFINDFDLSKVKRFYKTTHFDIETVRAWQVHQKESKWFHCIKGSFIIKVADLITKEVKSFTLSDTEPTVLHIPPDSVPPETEHDIPLKTSDKIAPRVRFCYILLLNLNRQRFDQLKLNIL